MSALRARWALAGICVAAVLAGCTNPDYNTDGGQGDACIGEDTTAPVAGDDCPIDEEGTGSNRDVNASAEADAVRTES